MKKKLYICNQISIEIIQTKYNKHLMKKIFFVAAATALALSSCSDNEINSIAVEKAQAPISISVYNQGQTRVTETVLSDLEAGFQLKAFNGATPWINATVTASGGAWIIGDGNTNYYWPGNDATAITFYGLYSPGSETIANDGTVTFTPNGDSDIVASYKSISYGDTNETGMVSLQFSHINAQVAVATAVGDNTTDFGFEIEEIVYKVPTSCVYDFATAVTSAASATTINVASELGVESMLILPATSFDMDVTYTVTEIRTGNTNTLTKTTTITPEAGKINRYNVTLPHERAAMIITVNSVDNWVDPAAE